MKYKTAMLSISVLMYDESVRCGAWHFFVIEKRLISDFVPLISELDHYISEFSCLISAFPKYISVSENKLLFHPAYVII